MSEWEPDENEQQLMAESKAESAADYYALADPVRTGVEGESVLDQAAKVIAAVRGYRIAGPTEVLYAESIRRAGLLRDEQEIRIHKADFNYEHKRAIAAESSLVVERERREAAEAEVAKLRKLAHDQPTSGSSGGNSSRTAPGGSTYVAVHPSLPV